MEKLCDYHQINYHTRAVKLGQVEDSTLTHLVFLLTVISDAYGFGISEQRGNFPKDPDFYVKPPSGVDTLVCQTQSLNKTTD